MSPSTSTSDRLLIKLRDVEAFAAADPRANLRPLYASTRPVGSLGLASGPSWYLADIAVTAENPWDLAHREVAAQLGIDASDVLFAEPDLLHTIYPDPGADRHRRTVRRRGTVRGEPAGDPRRQSGGPGPVRLASRGRLHPTPIGSGPGEFHRAADPHRSRRHGLLPGARNGAGTHRSPVGAQFRRRRPRSEQCRGPRQSGSAAGQLRPRHRNDRDSRRREGRRPGR